MEGAIGVQEQRDYLQAQRDYVTATRGVCNDETLTDFVKSEESRRFRMSYFAKCNAECR